MSVSAVRKHPSTAHAVIESLEWALCETMIATSKAQTYHWNVTGMSFAALHALFQTVYEDHFEAQDDLAERIKALGGHADGRPSVALKKSSITECTGRLEPEAMVGSLAQDQRTLSATLAIVARAAEEAGDQVSQDLAIERSAAHDKFAWMLEAHLVGRD